MSVVLDEAARKEIRPDLVMLTPREVEVIQLIASGLTNAEAAVRLSISVHAVKFHLAEIYRRLGVTNRTEAAVTYLRLLNGDGLNPSAEAS